jgi:hypothetical protein
MSKLRKRMIQDMRLASLAEGPNTSTSALFANCWPPTWFHPITSVSATSRNTSFTSVMSWAPPGERLFQCSSSSSSFTPRRSATTGLFSQKIVRKPRGQRLPDVHSNADCRRLIASFQVPLYHACFTLIYAYGLRINEAVTLAITAVDSRQMVLHVIGKRNQEQILPLRNQSSRCKSPTRQSRTFVPTN